MNSLVFFEKNRARWQEIETLLKSKGSVNPDVLSDMYILLNDDLAFAQTRFPNTKTCAYLNALTGHVHQRIYKNKKEKRQRFKTFWLTELPLLFYQYRKQLAASFIIFTLAALIGAVSAAKDENFVRLILGDAYVDQTLDNIAKGKPMSIYEREAETPMFLYITANNIRVSFLVFATGLFFSIGSGALLFFNGIMLGSFQYFFYSKGLLATSVLSIWVHGTLEITAIIIAGGAGIALGSGFMFPRTFPRLVSFQQSARDSVKIVIGLVPVFILAGFLEGFVTRHADVAPWLSVIIITGSLLFVTYYFLFYPNQLTKKHGNHQL